MLHPMYEKAETTPWDEIQLMPKEPLGIKFNWQLENIPENIDKKYPTYSFGTQPLDLAGLPRPSGGKYTEVNMVTLGLLGQAVRDGMVEIHQKYAGRYVNQSYIMSAKEIFEHMGLNSIGGVKLYEWIDNKLEKIRKIEGHDGKNSDKTAQHYHGFFGENYELSEVSQRTLKEFKKQVAGYNIEFSYQDGITSFPMDLVPPTEYDASVDVWTRCIDPKKLNIAEQLQQLDKLQRFKAVLEILHETYNTKEISENPLMVQHVYPWIERILGYDPLL